LEFDHEDLGYLKKAKYSKAQTLLLGTKGIYQAEADPHGRAGVPGIQRRRIPKA
jgi:hypothetical protein